MRKEVEVVSCKEQVKIWRLGMKYLKKWDSYAQRKL
jgi:hypothetical protein